MNYKNFIFEGEYHLRELLHPVWEDIIPFGWNSHFVDEVIDFGDGFYTVVNFRGEKILYHIFVDPEFESQGIATSMLLDANKKGISKIFNPNEGCISLLKHVKFKYGIVFEVI